MCVITCTQSSIVLTCVRPSVMHPSVTHNMDHFLYARRGQGVYFLEYTLLPDFYIVQMSVMQAFSIFCHYSYHRVHEIHASKLMTVIKVYIVDLHLLVNPRSLWYKVCAIFQVGSFLCWVAFQHFFDTTWN